MPASALVLAACLAALPLVGFVSLLLRAELDPHLENYQVHFVGEREGAHDVEDGKDDAIDAFVLLALP